MYCNKVFAYLFPRWNVLGQLDLGEVAFTDSLQKSILANMWLFTGPSR